MLRRFSLESAVVLILAAVLVVVLVLILVLVVVLILIVVLALVVVLITVLIFHFHILRFLLLRFSAILAYPVFQLLSFALKIRLTIRPEKIAAAIPPAQFFSPPVKIPRKP